MEENSETPENSSEKQENEMNSGESESKNEEENNEQCNSVNYSVDSSDYCRNLGGNRWPEQEVMALLEIRSNMDVLFKDPGLKSPLWEEVSRRMGTLGYRRSAMKCKEKFENVYKYNKRLKTASSGRPLGNIYRYFNQLEALDPHQYSLERPSYGTTAMNVGIAATPISTSLPYAPPMAIPLSVNYESSPFATSTSTPSSSGSESESTRKKKRKWANLFDSLMKSVLEKQEELQKKFLQAIDKSEQERLAREEAWKAHEIERIKKQRELLMHERSISATKDAAVLAFLQKISEQGNFSGILEKMEETSKQEVKNVCKIEKYGHAGENSASRWPKEEVEALIRIKSGMDSQNQRMAPLWEDISLAMKSIGYDRNGKKCKEKWENINKYYRRMKESNKKKPMGSKTCPYFHLLDSLYSMRTTRVDNKLEKSSSSPRPEELLMHIRHKNNETETSDVEASQNDTEDGNDGTDNQSVPSDSENTTM